MKKIIFICLTILSVLTLTGYANPQLPTLSKSVKPPVGTYNIRLGYKHLDGSLSTIDYTDSPGFTATNMNTGDEFECPLGSSPSGIFLPFQLPGTIENLPAGTYEFNAIRGQGNWTAMVM